MVSPITNASGAKPAERTRPARTGAGSPAQGGDGAAASQAHIDTRTRVENDGVPRQPHERDETADAQQGVQRPEIEQAARDLAAGQVDTDARGMRGAETVAPASRKTSDAAKTESRTDASGQPESAPEHLRNAKKAH